jgi:hypothetical protein
MKRRPGLPGNAPEQLLPGRLAEQLDHASAAATGAGAAEPEHGDAECNSASQRRRHLPETDRSANTGGASLTRLWVARELFTAGQEGMVFAIVGL